MLSAFQAQAIHELKPRDKSKIESLLAYGDRIFVGLNTGALRIYRVNDLPSQSEASNEGGPAREPAAAKPVELLREEEKFSKKAIQQLAMMKGVNLLISLSDAFVSLHDSQSYQLVERLERTRGATCFATITDVVQDPETSVKILVSRLAVGVKRKILCWAWQDMEVASDAVDISLEANIKSLNWIQGSRLIVGMDAGFSIVDVVTSSVMPINKSAATTTADGNPGDLAGVRFGTVASSSMGYMGIGSWVPKPMVTCLSGDTVLLAKDVNSLFIDADGKPLEKRQVPWALAPEAIGYSYPYLLALQPPEKGTLQIRNPDTLNLLQTIAVPGANQLHVPQPNISLAHAGKGFLVASDRVIWRMNALPYDQQFPELIAKQKYDEAISLLNLLEDTLIHDKAGRIREIKTLKATSLFQQQKYQPALDLFIDAHASPDRVVALYPSSIAGSHSSIPDETTEEDSEESDTRAEDASKDSGAGPAKSVLGMFKNNQKRIDSDAMSIRSSARLDSDNMSIRPSARPSKPVDKPLHGDDLKIAAKTLCPFLADARRQIQKFLRLDGTLKENPPQFDDETHRPEFSNLLSQDTFEGDVNEVDWEAELLKAAQLVDTSLFRAYMLAQPSLVGSLFRIDNFCEPQTVKTALYEKERYGDLVDFLHGKKLHRQALEMLTKFGKDEADGEVPEGMCGPERTVLYLKQLQPELIDVILEFVQWPISVNSEVAMEVFLADSDNAERLPRRRVLEFLAATDAKLEVQYLEHLIDELREEDADFHQRLVDLYLAQLQSPGHQHERQPTLAKLEAFLAESKVYNRGKTFRQLPSDDPAFFESRAIVLSAMGNHKQALSIYVYQIQDYDKAENYCNRLFIDDQFERHSMSTSDSSSRPLIEPENTPERPNIFATLLGLYLQPPAGEPKNWPRALDILGKHGARLPTSSTLDLMPADLAVADLQDYFRGRMRHATSLLREDTMVRYLEGLRREKMERRLLLGPDVPAGVPEVPLGRNRRFRVADDDHCPVCHRRFKDNSAVRVLPNNDVIHYACIKLANLGGVKGAAVRSDSSDGGSVRGPRPGSGIRAGVGEWRAASGGWS